MKYDILLGLWMTIKVVFLTVFIFFVAAAWWAGTITTTQLAMACGIGSWAIAPLFNRNP